MRIQEIETVACLGTGVMGHGVAFLVAKAGYFVRMFGRSPQSIAKGFAGIDRAIALYEDNGLMPKGEGETIRRRITGVTDLEKASDGVDMVMESIAEDLNIKQQYLALAEAHCRSEAVIATNTSSLSLSDISRDLTRPENFLGLHFFSPPYLMPPVEVTPVASTLPSVRELGSRWVESLGNTPIPLETELQGFIGNRIQVACLREALYIVEQGWASAETVDKAVSLSLGRRYAVTGPIESADMGGLDVFNTVLSQLSPVLSSRTEPSPIVADALKKGNLGLKSGKGIYDWSGERISARNSAREQMLVDFMKQDMTNNKE